MYLWQKSLLVGVLSVSVPYISTSLLYIRCRTLDCVLFCMYSLFQVPHTTSVRLRSWISIDSPAFRLFGDYFCGFAWGFWVILLQGLLCTCLHFSFSFLTDCLTWFSPLVQCGIHGLPCDAKLTGPEAESNPKPIKLPPAHFTVAARVFLSKQSKHFLVSTCLALWPICSTFVSSV